MKKILFAIMAMLISVSALASCDIYKQDCRQLYSTQIDAALGRLKNNQQFLNNNGAARLQEIASFYQRQLEACTAWICINSYYQRFYGALVAENDKYTPKKAVEQQTPKVADKWAEQCVAGAKPNVFAYADEGGVTKTSVKVSEFAGYKVTKTNAQLVGLTDPENNQFVGWVKKTDVQMQDLRNCNF